MRITIMVDDIAPDDVKPVQGFSALVETDEDRLLFDTGPDGEVLLQALERHGIGVQDLDMVMVSHSHDDHTAGLSRLLYHNPRLPVSVPVGASLEVARKLPREAVIMGEDRPREILPWISTTGDMGGSVPEQALLLETLPLSQVALTLKLLWLGLNTTMTFRLMPVWMSMLPFNV